MQTDPNPQAATPEDQALLAQARENEVQALNEYLQNRVILLNVEVRRRDQQIAELEAAVQDLRTATLGDQPEGAWSAQGHDVSGDGSGDQPQ